MTVRTTSRTVTFVHPFNLQPDETAPQQAYSKAVVTRKGERGRIESFREGWKHWVSLNATDLIWTALVIGGVLFTSCLMRGW